MADWTFSDIPSQRGRSAVVTGTGGLGYETALALARAGGEVILAGRNPKKGAASLARIEALVPAADIRFEPLDLASLASVKAFGERMLGRRDSLDVLINNAGVMTPPKRETTSDGFELQFGVNYLGHFALTAHLLPLLRKGRDPRVVNLSSLAHRSGTIQFDDLQAERRFSPWRTYQQSKLAMLMFALELQRRSDAQGWGLMSNAAHPGYARTDLMANGPGPNSPLVMLGALLRPLSQSAAEGALPTLFAATSPAAVKGGYYGPGGFYEMKGPPKPAKIMPQAKDPKVAARLWEVSEKLTGTTFGGV
ncbi:SDR family oxidoreductase [Caulobacter sp. S45]|uniref:SDR family oxidoreductase n=1 Tax=Caulobacter sp. S45 TaxID=1641861 RepID=UPI00131BA0FE|nr:SDR family oxidoreductase [Caulobacter sp. S45]